MAALGEAEGGAYILGGYGSKDGQQVNNPKSLFDLVYLDVNKQQITPVYQLSGLEEGTAFANSLVVDEANRSYYGLIFSKHSFNSTLQLIHGSLDSASFTRLGHPLPYKFQDVKSFVDLFYCNRSGKFITVTLFQRPDKQTEAEIYTLESPPLVLEEVLPVMETNGNRTYVGSWLALVLLIIAGVVFYRYRSRTKKPVAAGVVHVPKDGEVNIPDELPSEDETKEAVESEAAAVKSVNYEKSSPTRNSIVLFGATQIFDDEGNDITNLFTPLIKELFLLILLYSLRWEIGISSGKLKEVLWLDKSEESARNNRSVNLAKLKGILTKLNHCEISKKTGYWKTDIDHAHLYVDYYEYLNIVKETRLSEKEKIKKIAEIVQRGSFLSDLNYEWLDSFKSEISNEVIDIYLKFAHSVKVSEDPEFLIKVANYIFHFDAVNEEAMTLKCRALAFLGKHSLAKVTFEQFTKEYHRIYGEEFTKGFQSILED
ncbi:hypothetical protein [Parapedobacter indicus]|uniref:hypothetical protein n=1 Tax=Parapedobacter indicus TaxID=1477437 RepID=UPI000B846E11|nr:hypothetical protein [Parapedobacter indicus]